MKRSFINTQVKDPELARVQSNVEVSFRSLDEVPFLDGRRHTGLELSTTELRIAHGLNRKPQGFIVLTRDAAQEIYESSISDLTYINFKAGGAVTADVWVF
tara:strand:- start:5535 stop:5837 length:303 start_codon:yes stop_codon:yes gene_type:complete